MRDKPRRLLMASYFFPRGGSAHAARDISGELERQGFDVTIVSGSRSDGGEHSLAEAFYDGHDVRGVDFTLTCADAFPAGFDPGPGGAPMQGSYEEREGAEDPVMASLDDTTFELHVAAWMRELRRAGAADADCFYLHHLTPVNEAAQRAYPEVPVIGHIHGSELLMLERIAGFQAGGAQESWPHAERWVERICEWAERCSRIVVNSEHGLKRAARLLDLDPARFDLVPNGVNRSFAPRKIDRRAHWRHHLAEQPQGWRPGEAPGSVRYTEADLDALTGTVLLCTGRFTDVKRIPLLIEAYADARERFLGPASLVLLGGFPGEWEGEHPLETIERLAVPGVFLAGWHAHGELPDFFAASDLLVHASVLEQFGLVIVEAMACEVPAIAVDRGGPATIIDAGETGWLVEPDDRIGLADAMVAAVNDPAGRCERGRRARAEVLENYTWEMVGEQLAEIADAALRPAPEPAGSA
jgi:glycosyltransferase involved in cell wall biosynthesis